ncbi:MAG: endonuclease/exonuclease/phosphatase, partial [Flavobacteriaceae bacterium]|nr:endonuclease/exonuclease/phosphatase [Flavobacteriaceae bacterium]
MKNLFVIIFMLVSVVSEAQQISVLTYNIKFDDRNDTVNNWEARKEFLISQLNYNHPDVFGIQEGLQHQLGDIKNGLEAYQYIGVARDDGKSKGEYS